MKQLERERQMIQILEAIQAYGNVSQAAEALFMTQPTVSKIIRNQEKQYGISFLDRTEHPLKLTYAGEFYLDRVRKLVADYQTMTHDLSNFADNRVGRLTIGVNQSLAQVVLPAVLPEFHRRYPQIQVQLSEKTSATMEEEVLNQELDLYVGITPAYNERLHYQRLYTDGGALLLPKQWAVEHVPEEQLDISPLINGKDFVVETERTGFQRIVNSYLTKYNVRPNIVLRTANITTAMSLTAGGMGATIAPQSALTPELLARTLVIKLTPTALQCDIAIVYNNQNEPTKQAQSFIDLATRIFETTHEERD